MLDRVHLIDGDLGDLSSAIRIMQTVQPDEVYNLAAQSFVPTSFQQPILTGEVTALGVEGAGAAVTLHVELLMPDRSLWSGEAGMVIAKTIDGDIGILPGHAPVFGILSPGSLVRIREVPGDDSPGDAVRAAVRDGFLSVTNDRVSILASVVAFDVWR